MKSWIFFFVFSSCSGVRILEAQHSIDQYSFQLNEALIQKDQKSLQKLLDKDLSYGHSNGWVETKEELLKNNREELLIYRKILVDSSSLWVQRKGKIAFIRYEVLVDVEWQGKPIGLKMHVAQVWRKKYGGWKLLFRQSTKLTS
ncbi:MAG: nuclear transport factor 2 family protein [Saprospiraceae bacterium]|nr:nuclear transport factor 2 family protein [Saprospiraceae bacterium]